MPRADARLAEWQANLHWQAANAFQEQQLFVANRLTGTGWQARAARLRVALEALARDDFAAWRDAQAGAPVGQAAYRYWLDQRP